MNGHLDLSRGRSEWEEGIVSYWDGLDEFVCQGLIEGRKGHSQGVKAGRHQGQQAARVDHCSEQKRKETIDLSKNSDCDIGSGGGNAEIILVREGGGAWGEEASIGGWEPSCSLFRGNGGAGRGHLGCCSNTFSLAFLHGPVRVRGSNIGRLLLL